MLRKRERKHKFTTVQPSDKDYKISMFGMLEEQRGQYPKFSRINGRDESSDQKCTLGTKL